MFNSPKVRIALLAVACVTLSFITGIWSASSIDLIQAAY